MLVALYERAVAAYAELIDVNAFNQPGVEAYKRVSTEVADLQCRLHAFLSEHPAFSGGAADWAAALGAADSEAAARAVAQRHRSAVAVQ